MKVWGLIFASAAMLATGRKALENDGVATAWRIAQQAVAEVPESAEAHEFAGEVLFRRGEFAKADAEFKNAAELNPRLASAWLGLARVAACAAMNRTALEDVKRAYDIDPKDPRIAAMVTQRPKNAPRAELATPYRAYDIPLLAFVNGASHLRTYGVEVLVNGTPLKLVVDTGAAGVVLMRWGAERAGLVKGESATVGGVGDGRKASAGYRAVAENFRIGDLEYRNVTVSVAEQPVVGIEDGLIGSNVLSEFLITLDFAGGKLRLDPLEGYTPGELQDRMDIAAMKDATRVFRFGHLLMVPVKVNARPALFVLDTGAARTMISYDVAAGTSRLDHDERTSISGLSGPVGNVYRTDAVELEFAGFAQKNEGMSAIDTWELSHRLGTEISGFLGLPLLDLFKLTIDYRDGLVKFERAR
jgi:predicted aspartyl protease